MPDRACRYCAKVDFPDQDTLNHHVRRCEKNPNPTCPKCGLHFVPARMGEHKRKCETWKERPPAGASTTAASPAPPAREPQEKPGVLGVPDDQLTPTDELVLPLLAPPGEKPEPPSATPKRKTRGDVAAEDNDAEDEPEGGLAGRFEKRDPPRTAAFQGLADSVKSNWVLLAVIAAVLVVVIVLRRASQEDAKRAAPVQPAPPPVRPAYNPETHGSLEQYRATFGHLPSQGGA